MNNDSHLESVSLNDFRANPSAIMGKSDGKAVKVMKADEPYFYAVPPQLFEALYESMEDLALLRQAQVRLNDSTLPVVINLDELS